MKAVFTHLTAGQPDLLSLKAINSIMQADMLIAAAFVQKDLQEYLPKSCTITSDLRQAAEILAVTRPKESFQLVRVSSADAVITESLLEEVKFFKDAGFSTEIIPAVSGMQALAAARRFPLTRRGASHSFWVIDGKQAGSAARLFRQVKGAAASTATLVLLNTVRYKQELLALIEREREGDLIVCDPGREEGAAVDLIIVGRKEPGGAPAFSDKAVKLELYGTL